MSRDCAHLELVSCSSEDERFPATNLTCSGESSGAQLAVWESEKFCEFPQELVFRVNRGLPTRIEQVNLLSHPFKVATRMEIFTSSAASSGIHDGKTGVRFERLGFVQFLSSESTQLTACELQEVQLPRPISRITLLRLVLHSCYQTRGNLFSQVGLASVVALGPRKEAKVMLPMLPSPRKNSAETAVSPRRRDNHLYDARAAQQDVIKSPRARDIWIQDIQELKTPEQILAGIQIGKQLAQFAGNEKFLQPWVLLEKEADHLVTLLEHSAQSSRVHADRERTGEDAVLESFAELERRRKRQEETLSQQMNPSLKPRSPPTVLQDTTVQGLLKRFQTSQGVEKEALLWQLAGCSQNVETLGAQQRPEAHRFPIPDAESLEVLIAALDDSNAQVFVAGCAFFRALLTALPYFHDTVASKEDLAEILDCLLERLGSHDAAVRNSAAFAILTVAGSTRTRGTFVTHLLLKHVESKAFQPSDQQLLALLKLLAALLVSFHCCASLDIAPRRVLRFLLLSDAEQHENALVREAAKHLVLVLCNEVDEEFVLTNYVKKLPQEQQQRYDFPRRKRSAKCDSSEEQHPPTSLL